MTSVGWPAVDRIAGNQDRAGRLDGDRHLNVLPGADAAQHAARVVAHKAFGRERVACQAAFLRDAAKTRADLHALDGIDAHHGVRDVGVDLVKQRLAQAHGHAPGHHAQARTTRIARLAQAFM
jgi:hypothetical protein